jgi:hypothetical protein
VAGPRRAARFEQDIKPLFRERERDRDSMRFSFDLWSLDDVSTHADAILHRLEARRARRYDDGVLMLYNAAAAHSRSVPAPTSRSFARRGCTSVSDRP